MNEKWITYERRGRGRKREIYLTTRMETEPVPVGFSTPRPATDQEISDEKSKRQQFAEEVAKRKAFTDRSDYQSAMAIRDYLEFMTPESNPLGKLTPAEWEELKRKLADND